MKQALPSVTVGGNATKSRSHDLTTTHNTPSVTYSTICMYKGYPHIYRMSLYDITYSMHTTHNNTSRACMNAQFVVPRTYVWMYVHHKIRVLHRWLTHQQMSTGVVTLRMLLCLTFKRRVLCQFIQCSADIIVKPIQDTQGLLW